MPVILGHIYIPALYIVIYGVFNVIYVVAGGTNAEGMCGLPCAFMQLRVLK